MESSSRASAATMTRRWTACSRSSLPDEAVSGEREREQGREHGDQTEGRRDDDARRRGGEGLLCALAFQPIAAAEKRARRAAGNAGEIEDAERGLRALLEGDDGGAERTHHEIPPAGVE